MNFFLIKFYKKKKKNFLIKKNLFIFKFYINFR